MSTELFPPLSVDDMADLELDLMCSDGDDPDTWKFNVDVYMALGNVRDGAANKLIQLMRSKEDIHAIVREEIALALEAAINSTPTEKVKLTVDGDGQRTHGSKIATRRLYAQIGQYYEATKSCKNLSSEDAKAETADKFAMSNSIPKVSAAFTYNRKLQEAIASIENQEERSLAEHRYHINDIYSGRSIASDGPKLGSK